MTDTQYVADLIFQRDEYRKRCETMEADIKKATAGVKEILKALDITSFEKINVGTVLMKIPSLVKDPGIIKKLDDLLPLIEKYGTE